MPPKSVAGSPRTPDKATKPKRRDASSKRDDSIAEENSSQVPSGQEDCLTCPQLASRIAALGEFTADIVDPGIDELMPMGASKPVQDAAGKTVYLEMCKQLHLVPLSYFLRHLMDPVMNLSYIGLGALDAKAVCQALYTNPHIQQLNLSNNDLGEEGAKYVADLLKESNFITDINLANNHLGSGGAAIIADLLYANPTNLKKINVSGNKFKDSDALIWAEGLDGNDRLVEIDLSHNNFGNAAGRTLGLHLAGNNILEKVNLAYNQFRGPGAVVLSNAVKMNLQLTYLDLSWNGLGDEGGATIGRGLVVNVTLQFLNISNTRIGPAGTTVIAKGLEKNETLLTLKMAMNPITPEGSDVLLKCLMKSPMSNLQELDLSEIYVSKEFHTGIQNLPETARLKTVKYAGATGKYEIPLRTRRNVDETERLTRAKEVAKKTGLKLEKFLVIQGRDIIPSLEFRTLLEKTAKPRQARVTADEIATCLSMDGNIYCNEVALALEDITFPDVADFGAEEQPLKGKK